MATIPTADEVKRELARRDFNYFLKWSRPHMTWDWPHLTAMQKVLQALAEDEIENAMFLVPPQHGKTEQNTIGFNDWLLLRDPTFRNGIGAYNQELANRFSRAARRLAIEVGIDLVGDRVAVQEWQTSAGGGVRAVGIGAGLTGNPVDIGIIDDPIKDRKEADSQVFRDGQWEWYTDVWLTRNPRHQVLTLTPWHHDGLQARILNSNQAKRWTVVKLPALAVEDDPLGRSPGEALCPDRVTREELESRREMNPYGFEALYQCNPTPREGSMFKVGKLRFCDAHEVPIGMRAVRACDLGASTNGDPSMFMRMSGPDASGWFYVEDVVHGQWSTHERNQALRQTAERDGQSIRYLMNQDPGQAGVDQKIALSQLLAGFSFEFERETGSKETRAEPAAAQMEAGNIVMVRAPWNTYVIEELRQFPLGKHDESADTLARCINALALGGGNVYIF